MGRIKHPGESENLSSWNKAVVKYIEHAGELYAKHNLISIAFRGKFKFWDDGQNFLLLP